MKIGLFGSYDPHAPRLAVLRAGLAELGAALVECHEPMWGADREAVARAPWRQGVRWLAGQARLARRADELQGIDALLVPYPGHADMPLARRVASRLGVPLVFDPFLSLVDTVVGDRKLLAEGSGRARLLGGLERLALGLADVVLADTRPMATYYQALAGLPPERLAVVPVGADARHFARAPQPDDGLLEILFVGHMLPLHGIDTILAASKLLAGEPGLAFHLVGSGPCDAQLKGFAGRHTPAVPFADLPALMATAHVCLGAFGTSAKAARVVPHKVYQAAALGRAVVTRDGPAIREAFGEAMILVPPGDPAALAAALLALRDDPARRLAHAEAAHARFKARFDAPHVAAALLAALAPSR